MQIFLCGGGDGKQTIEANKRLNEIKKENNLTYKLDLTKQLKRDNLVYKLI